MGTKGFQNQKYGKQGNNMSDDLISRQRYMNYICCR